MFSKKLILTFILTVFFFNSVVFTYNNQKDNAEEEIVAKIGGEYVYTFKDLRKYVSDWSYDKRFRKNLLEGYNAALDSMVTNQLKRIDFFERGLNKDELLVQKINRIISEEIMIDYYNTQYLGIYTNDDYAEEIYGIADKEVKYQRILLELPITAAQEKKDSVQKLALKIQDEILNGKDFVQLVKQYSRDSLSLNTKGMVPPVGWEQSLSDPLGNVIFNLNPGDVRVIIVNYGYFVIKVLDVAKLDLKPFEEIKNEIKAKLKSIYLDKSLIEFRQYRAKLFNEDSINWNADALNKLKEWSEIPRFYFNGYQDTLQKAIEKNNFTILNYSGGLVDLKKYLYLLNNILIPGFSEKVNEKDIKAYIVEAIQTDMVLHKAEELGFKSKLFNEKTENTILKNQIAVLYNQAVIDSQIPNPTEKMLKEFYDEYKASLFYQLHKVNIYAMIFPDESQAKEVMQKINAGTPFEKISGRWLVKSFIRDRDGSIKSYLSSEEPYLGEAAMKLNLNETTGSVKYRDSEKGEQYAVIKCVNIRPAKQLLYEEVKNTIAGDYKNFHKEVIKKKVRDELWKKYDAEIYPDVIVKKLNSKSE